MNIAEHPVWDQLEKPSTEMPELTFRPFTAKDFAPPSDPRIRAASDDLAAGRIGLQQYIYRLMLIECEDEQNP